MNYRPNVEVVSWLLNKNVYLGEMTFIIFKLLLTEEKLFVACQFFISAIN